MRFLVSRYNKIIVELFIILRVEAYIYRVETYVRAILIIPLFLEFHCIHAMSWADITIFFEHTARV